MGGLNTSKIRICITLFFILTITVKGQSNIGNIPSIPKPTLLPPNGGGLSPSRTNTPNSTTERGQRQSYEHRLRMQQEMQRRKQIDQVLREEKLETEERVANYNRSVGKQIQYDFPSKSHISGTVAYRTAFTKLLSMDGDFSISKAVYTTENAYFNNAQDWNYLESGLKQIAGFLRNKMIDEGQNPNNNVAKNLMIYRLFSDTMKYADGRFHLPYGYDFEDYTGKNDFAKTMVLKLLGENSGQCHSLPLLYLMIAEYMDAEAYLVNAPMHTYIKFPLPSGGFQNIELTNDFFNTDAHVIVSGYVKAEALQSKLYMQPLTDEQLRSDNIADLAKSFLHKFGADPFVKEMVDSALRIDPSNIVALLVKSNYLTVQFIELEKQLGITDANFKQVLTRYPKAAHVLRERNQTYDHIDALGYEQMPDGAYQGWLQDMKKEIDKEDNEKRFIQLKNTAR